MTIYILFGEMGCGKNYVGKKLANHLGCEFFDGDDVLPDFLKEKVKNFKPISITDLDTYIRSNLIPSILEKASQEKDLVVAQALYRERHRYFLQAVLNPGPVKFVYVRAPSLWANMKRLYGREKGFRWALFGLFNGLFFQVPVNNNPFMTGVPKEYIISYLEIKNKTDADLTPQFERLVGELSA